MAYPSAGFTTSSCRPSRLRQQTSRIGLLGLAVVLLLAGCRSTRDAGTADTAPEAAASEARPLQVLFLGHASEHHNSAAYMPMLAHPLALDGIHLTYVEDPAEALTPETLEHYDALLLYANHDSITADQEQALLDYVASGHGFVPIHSASFCFRNSDAFLDLVGGLFSSHGAGTFTAEIVNPDHPIMEGLEPFETWDETYVHTRHNEDNRTVLMERVDDEGREPYTWVRTHGDGRVFYTAYGHDERTWGHPSFQQLVKQGIVWAVNDDARAAWERLNPPALTHVDAKLPNYERRDPPPKMQLPLSVEESQKMISVPAEFDVQLFAAEPDIINPMTMAFDERGRLWVVETVDYPNQVRAGDVGDDRIKILEDTNGDGRADTFTIFADSLNIPSSLVFVNDGVLVAQAPHFLFLKDTDGDDKADVKEIFVTGWSQSDTHAGPSNLQYGPDNYIWGTVGYAGFEGELDGKPAEFDQVAFRFKPDGSDWEVMTNTTNNTWGLGFSETFDVFGSTANNDPSWYMAIPDRLFDGIDGLPETTGYQSIANFYAMHPLTPNIRQVDVHGGYTAAAGHHLYTARDFPKSYWNRVALINEPTGHLLSKAVVEKQGSSFVTEDGWTLLASADEWVSPVHAQVGPDGAVWVADWYNFIVQHNPTPEGFTNGEGNAYETDLRDRQHGRIYRIVYKDAPAAEPRMLSKDDPDGLLDALASDNMFWRLTAQRLLVERGQTDVVPELIALVQDQSVDEIGINGGAFHALWTLEGLDALRDPGSDAYRAAVAALQHPAAGVRKAAAMVLPKTAATGDALQGANLIDDPDLHTRLAAVQVLAEMPASDAIGRALYEASYDPENYEDRWLSRALYIAAVKHRDGFLAAHRDNPNALPGDALPFWLRLGDVTPDWRVPVAEDLANWQDMSVPGNWESQSLPDFDGVVWFTRTFDWPDDATADSIHFGPIAHRDDVWINGVPVEGRRQWGSRTYAVPEGAVRPGENAITVRITNFRQDGGFLGDPEQYYLASGLDEVSLAGPWKYRIERQINAETLYNNPGELAAHVAWYYGENGQAERQDVALVEPAPEVVLTLSVIEHQLKYTKDELTVPAGQVVEIVFQNPDLMQHNVIIGTPGSLETIGEAADELAQSPDGVALQYIPDIPQVIVATDLVDPGETVRLRFTAPEEPGRYPYVCTFPGHWRLMNGILNVVPPDAE